MHRLIIASLRKSAGKTSIIVGLGRVSGKSIGYLKPFGDRLLYRKKRLWDYDAALVANVFKLDDNPEEMSIGFDHSKLRFMYNEESTRAKLLEMIAEHASERELLFIEGGREIGYGISVHLDAVALARHTGARLVFVLSGDEGALLDDATFIRRELNLEGVSVSGLILNRVPDIEDFKTTYLGMLKALGLALGFATGMVVIYGCGVAWLCALAHQPVAGAIAVGALPFLAGDALLMIFGYFFVLHSPLPIRHWEIAAGCVALGAALGVIPFILDYRAMGRAMERGGRPPERKALRCPRPLLTGSR